MILIPFKLSQNREERLHSLYEDRAAMYDRVTSALQARKQNPDRVMNRQNRAAQGLEGAGRG